MRKLAKLFAILLIVTLLVSCAQSSAPKESSTTTSQETTAPGDSSSDSIFNKNYGKTGALPIVNQPVTLTVWAAEIIDNNYWTNVTTTEYEKMTGVHIEWKLRSQSEDYNTAFNLLIASKDYPDIITSGLSTDQINMCIEGNVLLPLNDLIEEYGFYYKRALEENPEFRDYLTAPDGNIYTFFYTDTGVHKASEYKMWVYTEWLDKLGLGTPTTIDDFKNMLIAFRDRDPNGNGVKDEIPLVGFHGGRKSSPICYLMNPFQLYNDNYFYISEDREVIFIANTDGWREGLRYIHDLYKNGLILEETFVQDQTQFQALLNRPAGETIVGAFPFWYQGAVIDRNVLNWTDYQAIPPLLGPTGLRQTAARKGGDFWLDCAITTQCKNPEVAFMWLDWMLSDEGCYFGHFGAEGITYEWVDKPAYSGAPRSIKVTADLTKAIWNSGTFPRYDKEEIRYATTMDETQKNVENTYILVSAAKIYEPYYVWHNIPPIIWSNDTDLAADIADYRTLFNDYIASTSTAFILGELDINNDADWREYVKTLDDMGLQDYLDCLARLYDLK